MRVLASALLLALAAPLAAHARGLSVPLNHSVRLPLSGPAQSVVVGSPSVIDVAVVDSRTVYVSGKTPGDTDVTVIDPLGRVVFHRDVSVTVAGGASVSVFRGPARTEATCAPYCRDAVHDEETAVGSMLGGVAAARPAATGAVSGSPLGSMTAPLASASTTSAMSSTIPLSR